MTLLTQQIESLIYISADQGISAQEISAIIEVEIEVILEELKQLQEKYQSDDYSLELVNYGEKYHFITKPPVYEVVAKYLELNKVRSLTQSQLETLAIIAYKQPITRLEIEEIRGIGCELTLRKLLSEDLITEYGRLEAPGRPILYAISQTFLDTFKMVSLDELPEISLDIENDESQKELFQ